MNPLSALLYFRRNPGRAVPMGFVIVLCVFLIACISSLANSIDRTILTIYGYTRYFTYVIPQRVTLSVPPDQLAIIKNDKRIDRAMQSSLFFTNIKTVMGQLPFVVLGLAPDDRAYLMQRIGTRLIQGRMPAEGMPEAVLSEPLARNKKIKIGDVVAGPQDEGGIAGSPIPVRCVGIVSGPIWIALTTKSFCDATFLTAPHSVIYTTKNPADLLALNDDLMPVRERSGSGGGMSYSRYAGGSGGGGGGGKTATPAPRSGEHAAAPEEGRLSRSKVLVLSRQNLIFQLRDSLSTLFLIMGFVNGTVIFVIALMSGMLANIYFTQRIAEFAVLAAVGYQRTQLVRKVVTETALLSLAGWVLGVILTYCFLSAFRESLFEPKGLFVAPLDPFAYEYTLPIPVSITLFAVATIAARLLRFDPVTIIERR